MHWPTHLQETARHLVWMAQIPGAQDHAKRRRDELLSDPLYEGLREMIVAAQREAKTRPSTSTSPGSR